MDPRAVREVLERVRAGETEIDDALEALRQLPFRDLGIATVDHHRALRQGVPEVIFGLGKTVDQIAIIAEEIVRAGQNVLVTRLDAEKGEALSARLPGLRYATLARTGRIDVAPIPQRPTGPVAVVTAGTSDLPVAEEAIETLDAVGLPVTRLYDIGVASPDSPVGERAFELLDSKEVLERASPALKITVELRKTPCMKKALIFKRVKKEGDQRTLDYLQAMHSSACNRRKGECCFPGNKLVEDAIRTIQARLWKK